MHLASARVRSTNKARAQNAIEVYEPYPRGTQNLAAHALEARLDVVVDVALLGPLAEADRALVVEVLINKNLAVLDLRQQKLAGRRRRGHEGLDFFLRNTCFLLRHPLKSI